MIQVFVCVEQRAPGKRERGRETSTIKVILYASPLLLCGLLAFPRHERKTQAEIVTLRELVATATAAADTDRNRFEAATVAAVAAAAAQAKEEASTQAPAEAPADAEVALAKLYAVPTPSLLEQELGMRTLSTPTTVATVAANGEREGDLILAQGDGLVDGSHNSGEGGDGCSCGGGIGSNGGGGEAAAIAKVRLAARACGIGVKRGLRLAARRSLPAAAAAAERPREEEQDDKGVRHEGDQMLVQEGSMGEREGQEPGTRAAADGLAVRWWRWRARVAEARLEASEVMLSLAILCCVAVSAIFQTLLLCKHLETLRSFTQ